MEREIEILTLSEVARFLCRSESSVRQNADSGRIPCTRTEGGQRIFRRKDVERFAAERAKKNEVTDDD